MLAGDLDQGGLLTARTGPITVPELAVETGLGGKQQGYLDELVAADFLYIADKSTYGVQRWSEKAGDRSTDRVRSFRERKGNVSETFQKQKSNAIDVDKDKDKEEDNSPEADLALLRSAFGGTEDDVAAFLAMVAEKNRSGKITIGREITLRTELLEVLNVRLSGVHGALSYGLNAAIKKNADSTGYVREAGLTWLRQPRNLASVQNPKPRSVGRDLSQVPD